MPVDSLQFICRRLEACTSVNRSVRGTKVSHVIADRLLIQAIRNLARYAPPDQHDLTHKIEHAYRRIGKYYV